MLGRKRAGIASRRGRNKVNFSCADFIVYTPQATAVGGETTAPRGNHD